MSQTSPPQARSQTTAAQEAAAWLRQLARALRMFRLYRGGSPIVTQAEQQLAASLVELLARHGGWQLGFGASEIRFRDEVVVRAGEKKSGDDTGPSALDQLPFLIYRDGIRRMTLAPGTPRGEVEALLDSLRRCSRGPDTQDDLVT